MLLAAKAQAAAAMWLAGSAALASTDRRVCGPVKVVGALTLRLSTWNQCRRPSGSWAKRATVRSGRGLLCGAGGGPGLAGGRCTRSSSSAMVRLVGAARACAAGGLPLGGGSGGGVFGGGQAVGAGGGAAGVGSVAVEYCGELLEYCGVLWSTLENCRRRRRRGAVGRFGWHGGGGGLRRCSGQRGRRRRWLCGRRRWRFCRHGRCWRRGGGGLRRCSGQRGRRGKRGRRRRRHGLIRLGWLVGVLCR
jgi:hypothetical protein